ncbi:MAG TPA: outer membrane lipoprotein carrier protein LolA [Gemmatimonadales bacterium]|nr:outer membrane lipoprotein carrier protein LolA [Gemmatimonadales bacterium]
MTRRRCRTGRPAGLLALAALCAVGLHPSRGSAQDPVAIVRRAGAAYRSLTSLQADFVQVIEDTRLGDTLSSTGRLYQAGQNNFAMRFTDPPEEAIVIDGRYSWFYTPSTAPHQVIRMAAESDPVYGQNLLARVLDRPSDRYETAWLRADTVGGRRVSVISIVPRGTSLNFSRAVLWLDQEDALPRRIELDEGPGTRRILTLSRIRTNAAIPPDIFEFKVPRGVRIVDQ